MLSSLSRAYLPMLPILALGLIILGLASYGDRELSRSTAAVEHAQTLRQHLERQVTNLVDAETGQRGYLLTRRTQYLKPYAEARGKVAAQGTAIEQLATPEMMPQVKQLQETVRAKLDELSESILLLRVGHLQEALDLLNSDVGNDEMAEIRELSGALIETTERVLAKAEHHATVVRLQIRIATYVALGAALLAMVLLGFVIRRDTQRKTALFEEMSRLHEEAEGASRAKSEFLATMSHEIRTPINGIIGMNEILLRSELTPTQERYAKAVQTSADVLKRVIDDVLDVAKLEAGRLEVEAVEFDLAETIEQAVSSLQHAAERAQIEVRCEVRPDVPPRVIGDPVRLRQILLNIVGNAVKFTEHGFVAITVSAVAAKAGPMLSFRVQDTGPGIAPDVQRKLFGKFTQADSSIARRFGGTGLGLAISRQLVELMGGEIGLDSHLGEGSNFWFSIPLRVSVVGEDEPSAVAPQRPPIDLETAGPPVKAPLNPHQTRPLRILVAEDNEINQMLIETLLTEMGHEVTIVGDGAGAIDAAETRAYDLVLMDVQMPGMDGISATREIRRRNNDVPVVALTAHVLVHERQAMLDAGMQDHLAKPLAVADLVAVLHRIAA